MATRHDSIPTSSSGGNGLFARLFGNGDKGFSTSTNLISYLGSLQTNVFFADSNFNIVYANNKAIETLRDIEDKVKKAFRVSIDEIVGGSIHRFHKDSRRIERILQDPRSLSQAAHNTKEGSTDTQKAAAELSKMANDLQKIVAQFKN